MDSGQNRQNISIGLEVDIVQKQHQVSGKLTNGFVKRILTNSKQHPHGIKVMIETGEVGRVKHIYLED
ncbi:MAG: YwbE family protein [Bacteroidia bacterium]|nr:YwbE family protein [Bacteroidia bacterium]